MRRGRGMVGGGAGAHDESHRYRVAQNCIGIRSRTHARTLIYTFYTQRDVFLGTGVFNGVALYTITIR